jgi:hypothetical protein
MARDHEEVLPSITGWAQVNDRNALTCDQKFEYDGWYVDNVSLAVDLHILLKTLTSVTCLLGIILGPCARALRVGACRDPRRRVQRGADPPARQPCSEQKISSSLERSRGRS